MGRLVLALVVATLGFGCTPPSGPHQAPPDIGRRGEAAVTARAAAPASRARYAGAPSASRSARAIAFTWISSVPA
jgi:hypothetical protein